MLLCILVETGGVGFEQGARVGWQLGIFPLRRAARVDQVIREVELRPVLTRNRAIAPLGHGDDVLKREEIVLCMRNRDPVCDVGVGIAIDHRHAIFAAHDLGGIFAIFGRLSPMREERLPRGEGDECDNQHGGERDHAAFDEFHGEVSPALSGAGQSRQL